MEDLGECRWAPLLRTVAILIHQGYLAEVEGSLLFIKIVLAFLCCLQCPIRALNSGRWPAGTVKALVQRNSSRLVAYLLWRSAAGLRIYSAERVAKLFRGPKMLLRSSYELYLWSISASSLSMMVKNTLVKNFLLSQLQMMWIHRCVFLLLLTLCHSL